MNDQANIRVLLVDDDDFSIAPINQLLQQICDTLCVNR